MFKTELLLQEKFIELKNKGLNDNEQILSEFNARFGNVDIVQVINNSSNFLNCEQAEVLSTYHYAKILSYIHKKAVRTYNYLYKRSGYTEQTLKAALSKLIKIGIVNEIAPKRYVIAEEFEFPHLQFISYEAKLHDWKKAMLQAYINQKFSTYSYIVLPIKLARRLQEKYIGEFESRNIGLIGVSEDTIEYLYTPKKKKVKLFINPTFISSIAKFQLETSIFSDVSPA